MLSNDILEQMTRDETITYHYLVHFMQWFGICKEQYQAFKQLMTNKYNEMENVKINIPEGYEVDWAKSAASQEVVLKKKVVAYKDVAEKLFNQKQYSYTSFNGEILQGNGETGVKDRIYDPNNALPPEQLEAILALNQLCNVAKYLNGGWLPGWKDEREYKHFIIVDHVESKALDIHTCFRWQVGSVFFKSEALALQAIEILGEDTIRKALTLNH